MRPVPLDSPLGVELADAPFPVVLKLDAAEKWHAAIKYGSLLAGLNLLVAVALLKLLDIFPNAQGIQGNGHGLAKLALILVVVDAALVSALSDSVFSRVVVHWDRLELIVAGRCRVAYIVEVNRLQVLQF